MSAYETHISRTLWSLLLLLALIAGNVTPARAQDTRFAQIAEQQRLKAAQLTPETSPAGEVLVTRVMRSPLLTGTGAAYPWFGSLYNGAGFGLGAGICAESRAAAASTRRELWP